jgi:hypothetical protein
MDINLMNIHLENSKKYGIIFFHIMCSGFLLLILREMSDIKWFTLAGNIVFIIGGVFGGLWGINIVSHFWENQRYNQKFKYLTAIFVIFSFGIGVVAVFAFFIWYTFDEVKREKLSSNRTLQP